MAREIVLDTETTGLDPRHGHRLIEIACIEINECLPTGRHFHVYIDPEREIDVEAEQVHGISRTFLVGKPKFADPEVAAAFLEFVGDAPLIAHNAGFDRNFINSELALAGLGSLPDARWIDTLAMAQKRFPGAFNSLDALCKRFKISLAEREKHGALVDARLLATVYLELLGGRERKLDLGPVTSRGFSQSAAVVAIGPRPRPLAPRLTEAERTAHAAFVKSELKEDAVWLKLEIFAVETVGA